MIQEAIDNLKKEIHTFYEIESQKAEFRISDARKYLRTVHAEYGLPETIAKSILEIAPIEASKNIFIPSPLSIGSLRSPLDSSASEIPAFVDFISSNGLCIDIDESNQAEAHQWMQNIGLKIMTSLSPDLIDLVVIDTEGSGSNFTLLCDYIKAKPVIVTNRELNNKLSSLDAQFSSLQMRDLGNKYDNLEAFNINEGKMTKPYTFIFISNYPAGFNLESLLILKKIVTKGGKWGAFVFMSNNVNRKPEFYKNEDLNETLNKIGRLSKTNSGYAITQSNEQRYNTDYILKLDTGKPNGGFHMVAQLSSWSQEASQKPINQDEYFDDILNERVPVWQEYLEDGKPNIGLKVPIGKLNAKEDLELTIDCGTPNSYHGIIGGKTGTGKTVLLNNIIINACIKYSPIELSFILLDFKGVSFEIYKKLPHARAIFCGIDRTYGLNVLRYIEYEYQRRYDIFSEMRKVDINEFNKNERTEHSFSRMLIVIDEFQDLLKYNDEISKEASNIIDKIAQKGRSYGMNMLLCSQDLTGYTISETAQTNSAIRIALDMDPQSFKKIFSSENTGANSLSEQKGLAIFNNGSGHLSVNNKFFQVFNLKKNTLEKLIDFMSEKYRDSDMKRHDVFFLPNEKASSLTDNKDVIRFFSGTSKKPLYPKIFLGDPTFIKVNEKINQKEDSFIKFKRDENSNLLIAGKDTNAACTILGLTVLQLLSLKREGLQIHLLNTFGVDKALIKKRFKALEEIDDCFRYYSKQEAADFFKIADEQMAKRKLSEEAQDANCFLIILNLDASFQKQGLKSENASKLINILNAGPSIGVHSIVYSYLGKSLYGAGIEPNLFENKIVLKGDGKDIVGTRDKEPKKERQGYLYAPLKEITSINPDLFNVYSAVDETKLISSAPEFLSILKEMVTDFVTNDDEDE